MSACVLISRILYNFVSNIETVHVVFRFWLFFSCPVTLSLVSFFLDFISPNYMLCFLISGNHVTVEIINSVVYIIIGVVGSWISILYLGGKCITNSNENMLSSKQGP